MRRERSLIIMLLVTLSTLCAITSCTSDSSTVGDHRLWTVDFGGRECAYAMIETATGEFVICGSGPGHRTMDEDVYVALLSEGGEVRGQICYGGDKADVGRAIVRTLDHGLAIAGTTASIGAGQGDILLLRLASNGDSLWCRSYGGSRSEDGWAIDASVDSGFYIVGSTSSQGHGKKDAYVLRVDALGDTTWTRTYGGTEDDDARAVLATGDGGCILVGSTQSYGAGYSDIYVVRVDPQGDSLWARAYGSVDFDAGYCAIETVDHGFLIGGTSHLDAPAGDVYLIRITRDGDLLWEKRFGSYQGDCAYDIEQTQDGGFVLTGLYTTPAHPDRSISSNVYLIKTDSAGNPQWEQNYGGLQQECGYSVLSTVDGAFVIAGGVTSLDGKEADLLWIKASPPKLK